MLYRFANVLWAFSWIAGGAIGGFYYFAVRNSPAYPTPTSSAFVGALLLAAPIVVIGWAVRRYVLVGRRH